MSVPDFSALDLALEPVPDFDGWFQGPYVDWEQGKILAARVRTHPAARGFFVFVGALDDEGHRIYVTPPMSPRELVQDFGLGGHGGHSAESADREIGERLEKVQRICPLMVTFVDSAGLHVEFTRPLNESAAARIEEIFTRDEDSFNLGLESYLSGWTGEGPLFAHTLVAEQGLRLWWD